MPLLLALQNAGARLLRRVDALEARLDQGENVWTDYLATLTALVAVVGLTTKQLGERLGITDRTVRRRARAGKLASVSKIGARWRA
jgi:hypothetical protein